MTRHFLLYTALCLSLMLVSLVAIGRDQPRWADAAISSLQGNMSPSSENSMGDRLIEWVSDFFPGGRTTYASMRASDALPPGAHRKNSDIKRL
jgi:hypothetical protein